MGSINANEKETLQEKLTALWDTTLEGQASARSIQMRTVAAAIKKLVSKQENLTKALFWLDSLSKIVTTEDLAVFKGFHDPHEYAGLSADEKKFKSEMVQIAEWIAELQAPIPKKPKHPLTPFKLSNWSLHLLILIALVY